MSVEELVQKANAAGAETITLTDINNSTAIPGFYGECTRNSIKPVAGIEFKNDNELQYIGIARKNNGMRELNEFLSKHCFEKTPLTFPAPQFTESFIIYSLKKLPERKLFDNEYIGIRKEEINKLFRLKPDEKKKMVALNPVSF